ncbi:hypothetical protein [Curtobacterium citreum]|uniref:hypothetical protein n=1 Tax=Curtobacterium citreum TaxID=2036 RepID=UPI0007373CD7|nr:hypothetical protein [Curtobacterium citreum]KTR23724.1 hypothetical protein NS330_03070 [Curtobacterium citreum]
MSDPNQTGDVFGAASRASDYIEEDTVGAERLGRRATPRDEAAGLRPIPPMPPLPVQAEEAVEPPPSLAVVSDDHEEQTAARRPVDREASASVLFGAQRP